MGPTLLNLTLAAPFVGALLVLATARHSRSAAAWTAAAVMAAGLVALVPLMPAALAGKVLTTRIPWLPEWGLDFALRLDGLGLLFALLILGIGLLIVLYAAYYLPTYGLVGNMPQVMVQLRDVGPRDLGYTMTSQRRQDRQLQEAAISFCGALLDPQRHMFVVEAVGEFLDGGGPPVGVPSGRRVIATPGGGNDRDRPGTRLLTGQHRGRAETYAS